MAKASVTKGHALAAADAEERIEELRQARKALADLEEELRTSGGPPGWGRE